VNIPEDMLQIRCFWQADPHQFGPGKVHVITRGDKKTLCGLLLTACPGKIANTLSPSCKNCLNAEARREERDYREEQEEQKEREQELERIKEQLHNKNT
jgi:hypothetical protein